MRRPQWLCVLAALCAAAAAPAVAVQTVRAEAAEVGATPFRLHIVHLNDFHARYEEVSLTAGACKEGDVCIGGLARVASAIAAEKARDPDALVLNAGDNYQGTLWYSLFRWNVTAHFMNMLPWDAMTIGNHEFDHGIAGLVPFLELLNCPTVIANMDDSKEETMHGLWKPSIVKTINGRKVGIVGYIWKDTWTIATTEGLVFGDELEALDKEAAALKEQGVDIIVALSHAGLDVDLEVAKQTKYADVIVGGHSHTLLYNGDPPAGDRAAGPYPEVVRQDSGRTVLVVQASAYTKYLGNLSVEFDEQGEVTTWEGQPIYMANSEPQDESMLTAMVPWRELVEATGKRVLGSTRVTLDRQTFDCYDYECSLGNFVTDAMVDYYVGRGPEGSWTAAAIAFTNAGGLRTNIVQGDITYADMVAAQPFENSIDLVQLQGDQLLQLLEDSVNSLTLLQWSGLRVQYDFQRSVGQRVVSAEVRCASCAVPRYSPIDPEEWYSIAAPSFVIEGGDNFQAFKENLRNRTLGPVDSDVFEAYLASHNPVLTELEGRITIEHGKERRLQRLARRRHRPVLIFY